MGALHAGHVSLIDASVKKCNFTVVSIFVNPTQFAPSEDLDSYPRDLASDTQICAASGVDIVFAPSVSEMYPDENITWVTVEKLTEKLCGRSRPEHFKGVTTVCSKLFNIVAPDFAFFGQKDAQQVIVIKRMVADLNMPLEIITCPIIREPDGLALSSRNKYLTPDQRKDAPMIYQTLKESVKIIAEKKCDSKAIIAHICDKLQKYEKICIEYVDIVSVKTLNNTDTIEDNALIVVAVKIGKTRLIDNILIDLKA
jgi:pantoate--beta-alanine ligase